MNYYAANITDYTFKQLDETSSESEKERFQQLCYEHPLIFVKQSHGIIFFNMNIKLDQVQYDFLYELVKNATTYQKNKGLSPIELFEALNCKHTREKSNNKNYKKETIEYDRANERMRDIKRCIKKAILDEYDRRKKNLKELIEKTKDEICENTYKSINEVGIRKISQEDKIIKYFNNEFEISEDSPYYNFEIKSVINILIINQRNKCKKYTTEFIFRN